ncbi:hypothetical protein QN239_32475 [Mycolicibacterium sp. Y3]
MTTTLALDLLSACGQTADRLLIAVALTRHGLYRFTGSRLTS